MVIFNAGFPGQNTRDALKRFPDAVASHAPDCVVLLFGTNDLLNSWNYTGEEEYRRNLKTLAEQCLALSASLILCQIPLACQTYMESRHKPGFFQEISALERCRKANAVIAGLAQELLVPLVPVADLLGIPGEDSASLIRNPANSGDADGVHPTAHGYAKIAAAVAAAVRRLPRRPHRIVCFGDSITFGLHMRGGGTAAADAECYPGQLARLLR